MKKVMYLNFKVCIFLLMIIFAIKLQKHTCKQYPCTWVSWFLLGKSWRRKNGSWFTYRIFSPFLESEREFKIMRGNISIYFSLFLSTLIHLCTFVSLNCFTITNYYNWKWNTEHYFNVQWTLIRKPVFHKQSHWDHYMEGQIFRTM